jgi:hypothetical protein
VIGGALAGFAGSALTQGIQIAFGLQKSFDWKQLAADVAAGALGGIGGAFSTGAEALARVAQLAVNTVRIARIAAVTADTALNIASEAISQAVTHDGRIEQPWMLVAAAAGTVLGEIPGILGSKAFRAEKQAQKAVDDVVADTEPRVSFKSGAGGGFGGKQVLQVDADQNIGKTALNAIDVKADTNLAGSIKNVDTDVTIDSSGQSVLDVSKMTGTETSALKSAAYKPMTAEDAQAATVGKALSKEDADQAASTKTVGMLRDLSSGETKATSKGTQTDVAQTVQGKVSDNASPVAMLSTETKADSKLALTGDALAGESKLASKEPEPVAKLSEDEVLQSLIKDKAPTYLPRDPELTDFNKISSRYFLPAFVEDFPLPGIRGLAKKFGDENTARNRAFESGYGGKDKFTVAKDKAAWRILEHKDNLETRIGMNLVKGNTDEAAAIRATLGANDASWTRLETRLGDTKLYLEQNIAERDAAQKLFDETKDAMSKLDRAETERKLKNLISRVESTKKSIEGLDAVLKTRNEVGTVEGVGDRAIAAVTGFTDTVGATKGTHLDKLLTKAGLPGGGTPDYLILNAIARKQLVENVETKALTGYTAESFSGLAVEEKARLLAEGRAARTAEELAAISADARTTAEAIEKAFSPYLKEVAQGLKQFEKHEGTAYRGINLDDEQFASQFDLGGIYTERGVSSTATGKSGQFKKNTTLVINSRGAARKVAHIAQNVAEKEATLIPGTRFKVLRIDIEPDAIFGVKRTVYLDEVLEGDGGVLPDETARMGFRH